MALKRKYCQLVWYSTWQRGALVWHSSVSIVMCSVARTQSRAVWRSCDSVALHVAAWYSRQCGTHVQRGTYIASSRLVCAVVCSVVLKRQCGTQAWRSSVLLCAARHVRSHLQAWYSCAQCGLRAAHSGYSILLARARGTFRLTDVGVFRERRAPRDGHCSGTLAHTRFRRLRFRGRLQHRAR